MINKALKDHRKFNKVNERSLQKILVNDDENNWPKWKLKDLKDKKNLEITLKKKQLEEKEDEIIVVTNRIDSITHPVLRLTCLMPDESCTSLRDTVIRDCNCLAIC
jgi:hypothetical protein